MKVDLTDAARELGVSFTPRVIPDRDASTAGFVLADHGRLRAGDIIHHPELSLSHRNIDAELRGRARRMTGLYDLSDLDFVRWVMAHELGHALQWERHDNPDGYLAQVQRTYARHRRTPHGQIPIEREADELSRNIWPLVRINGHPSRHAPRKDHR